MSIVDALSGSDSLGIAGTVVNLAHPIKQSGPGFIDIHSIETCSKVGEESGRFSDIIDVDKEADDTPRASLVESGVVPQSAPEIAPKQAFQCADPSTKLNTTGSSPSLPQSQVGDALEAGSQASTPTTSIIAGDATPSYVGDEEELKFDSLNGSMLKSKSPATKDRAGLVVISQKSSYRGLCWNKSRQSWLVRIPYKGERIYVGNFPSEVEGALAYDKRAMELYGHDAVLNFPDKDNIPPIPPLPSGILGMISKLITSKGSTRKGKPAGSRGKKRKHYEELDVSSDDGSRDRQYRYQGHQESPSQMSNRTLPSMASMASSGEQGSPKRIKRVQALLNGARKQGDAMASEASGAARIANTCAQGAGNAPGNMTASPNFPGVMNRSSRGDGSPYTMNQQMQQAFLPYGVYSQPPNIGQLYHPVIYQQQYAMPRSFPERQQLFTLPLPMNRNIPLNVVNQVPMLRRPLADASSSNPLHLLGMAIQISQST